MFGLIALVKIEEGLIGGKSVLMFQINAHRLFTDQLFHYFYTIFFCSAAKQLNVVTGETNGAVLSYYVLFFVQTEKVPFCVRGTRL